MAKYTSSAYTYKSNYQYRAALTITTSETNTSMKISWRIAVEAVHGYLYGMAVKGGGAISGTASGYRKTSPGDTWTEVAYKTGYFTVSKTKSSQTKTLKAAAYGTTVNGIGSAGGSGVTVSHSVTIPALKSYTVSYSANSGSGAPGSQTKWYGTNLPLSSTKPTRSGYTFRGWGTSSSTTTVSYSPGSTYSKNASLSLYAVWLQQYTITFNANGGSGSMTAQKKNKGTSIKLTANAFTKSGYNFVGWGTSSSATTVKYSDKATYSDNKSTTLYAIWSANYQQAAIKNFKVYRCDSSGVKTLSGDYIKIEFDWISPKGAGGVVNKTKIDVSTGSYTFPSSTSTDSSGSFSQFILAPDGDTKVTVTLNDATETSKPAVSDTEDIPDVGYIVNISEDESSITLFGALNEDVNGLYVGSDIQAEGQVYARNLTLPNNRAIVWYDTGGDRVSEIYLNNNNNLQIGYYQRASSLGNTNIYGVKIGLNVTDYVVINSDLRINGHTDNIGHVYTSNGTINSVASGTSIAKQTAATFNNNGTAYKLGAGSWVITATVRYTNNSTGRRSINIYLGSDAYESTYVTVPAASGATTKVQSTVPTSQSSDFNVYIGTQQNSGSELKVDWYLRAVRIA